jgi:2-keto-4-pentenoate hydratase/2-oxohepta-3-ene-1,7-dioic acid hydratase in catechol pathway
MEFSLATIQEKGAATPVLEAGGKTWRLADLKDFGLANGLLSVVDDWAASEPKLAAWAERLASGEGPEPIAAPAPYDYLAPLLYPRKVVAIGYNYADHVAEGGNAPFDKNEVAATFFFKPPTTSVVGSGKTVRMPTQSTQFDWEVELAVVMGKGGRNIPVQDALKHVCGYTLGIDLSLRDLQLNPRHPKKWDLFCGKGFDHSCPLGPRIVPARFLDAQDIDLRLAVNGDGKQKSNSKYMVWNVAEQIAILSEHVTIEPGDVLLTGTPSGIGRTTGTFLRVGDRIDCEAPKIGKLTVEIVAG